MNLYHASPTVGLTVIEPRRTLSNSKYIGDYIFATSDIRLAAMYLVAKGVPILLNVKAKNPRVIIGMDRNEYLAKDRGGSIYTVKSDTFEKTPQRGLEESELVSKVAVSTIAERVFSSSMDALKETGVEVYFVSSETLDAIISNNNEDYVIEKMKPYLI